MYIEVNNKKIDVVIANSFFKRLIGFMFKKNISYILCFPKVNSIHTFFMKENIDVIMTDKNNNIIKIYKNLGKNKIILPVKGVYYTYEFPVGYINNFKINDYIKIKG